MVWKDIITTRFHSVIFLGCSSVVPLLFLLVCTCVYADCHDHTWSLDKLHKEKNELGVEKGVGAMQQTSTKTNYG